MCTRVGCSGTVGNNSHTCIAAKPVTVDVRDTVAESSGGFAPHRPNQCALARACYLAVWITVEHLLPELAEAQIHGNDGINRKCPGLN